MVDKDQTIGTGAESAGGRTPSPACPPTGAALSFGGGVSGYDKGGLIVKLGRLGGFVPASQVSLSRRRRAEGDTPDKRWGKMVGEAIVAKVIEVDRQRNRLIISERAAAREARKALKDRLLSELQAGEIRPGNCISPG